MRAGLSEAAVSALERGTRSRPYPDTLDRLASALSLTPAEKEVAELLLKGMRHKEIAEIRQTSERTVRQQGLSILCEGRQLGRPE